MIKDVFRNHRRPPAFAEELGAAVQASRDGHADLERAARLRVLDSLSGLSNHLAGRVLTNEMASSVCRFRSASLATPSGSIMAHPFIGLPVMSIGFACFSLNSLAPVDSPTRVISHSL